MGRKGQFVKGQVANPRGAGAHDKTKLAWKRQITNEIFKDIIDYLLNGNLTHIKDIAESKTDSALRVGVARAILNAAEVGDWTIIESIITRIIGKVPDRVEIQEIDGVPRMTPEEAVQALKNAQNKC